MKAIEMALIALGFICIKHTEGADCWILEDAREIQGHIYKCQQGHHTIDMESHQSYEDNSEVYDGNIGKPECLEEFKAWIAAQTKQSQYF
tara:strand:+ start:254 stop:523 length:270 start_codon:yes stop_codon:yes gene_type:complete